jgi:formylglycine-generating enzyme required for sulfatase activity
VVAVNWYTAASYCNWLSKEEGIPQDQWCYEISRNEIKLKAKYLSLSGYRLPTEAEMEYATRAGTVTSRYFGEADDLLPKYVWYKSNAQERTWPVGSLKPNDFGLFDTLGNVWTWCQEGFKPYPQSAGPGTPISLESLPVHDDKEDDLSVPITRARMLRGARFFEMPSFVRSACRVSLVPPDNYVGIGFRVARTLPPK